MSKEDMVWILFTSFVLFLVCIAISATLGFEKEKVEYVVHQETEVVEPNNIGIDGADIAIYIGMPPGFYQ
jgi:hypothetical protein